MGQYNWEIVTNETCSLGESPVWDPKKKRIFWVDILERRIHCFYNGSGEHKILMTPEMPGSIALTKSGHLIGAFQNGFAMINPETHRVKLVREVEGNLTDNRFNDGKCDPAGRFWAGTMSCSGKPGKGSLYMLDKKYSLSKKISGVGCSNGMAWSPDCKFFYYIDTLTQNVVVYNYDIINGAISNPKVIISISSAEGCPDGMTIDNEGMLWIAIWGGWKIVRFDPADGSRLYEFYLPVSCVSSCEFGGPFLEDIYVTTAKTGLSDYELAGQPLAGSLFLKRNCGFRGIPAMNFVNDKYIR